MSDIIYLSKQGYEDLKDELTELGDRIKYDYSNSKDLKYFRKLQNEFNNRI